MYKYHNPDQKHEVIMWSYFKLSMWGVGWFIAWVVMVPWRKGRHNCLTWAVEKWNNEGGYLVIRWSRHNTIKWIQWPHFLWLDEKYRHLLEHVVPEEEFENQQHVIPQAWFDPVTITGDSDDVVEN